MATCDTLPKAGEKYKCEKCGMVMQCTVDCNCTDASCVKLECCGSPLVKMCAVFLALLLFASGVFAQCRSGRCGSAGAGGYGVSMPMMIGAPMMGGCSSGSCESGSCGVSYADPFTIPAGHVLTGYEIWPDGSRRPLSAASWARITNPPAICPCIVPDCGNVCGAPGCPCPPTVAGKASACPECEKAAQMIRAKDLTEVKPDPSKALYQTADGSLFYLDRVPVELAQKQDSMILPSGKWVLKVANK